MRARRLSSRFTGFILAGGFFLIAYSTLGARALLCAQQPAASAGTRQIGTVKSIKENIILLTTDAGSEVSVAVPPDARILRAEPGQTDLKSAESFPFQEIQAGDRVLVRGKVSEDAKSLAATLVVAIKKASIEQKRAREREDWQKRGLRGLVKAPDPATQTLVITTSALTGSKPVLVRLAPTSVLRRYAANSVRFDDAKLGNFEDIKPGDQFRGRGARSADGSEFAAEEIITGSFRNIAGTVSAVDASAGTLTVADLATKQPVVVRVTPDSSLHKLPEMMAEGIAMRLKGAPPNGAPNGPPGSAGGQVARPAGPPAGGPPSGGPPGGWRERGPGPGDSAGNGPPDFQQMVARLPTAKLADFPKGEAVMIVATAGNNPGEATAINLLGGVEPLLRASPGEGQEFLISGWSLGGPSQEGATQ